jgi:hypothetical protein
MIRLHLGAQQLSALEINLTDPAHDDDREPWWPTVDGRALVFDESHRSEVASLLTDLANSEDYLAERDGCAFAKAAREALTTLSMRVRRGRPRTIADRGGRIGS